jgi:hypothetical protein
MSFLEELNSLLMGIGLLVETGVFSEKAGSPPRIPDEYIVITPMSDTFEFYADNRPQYETQEARLSLFSKGNYIRRKNEVVRTLLLEDFTITARLYVGYENDTGYYHYAIDVAKNYELEE